MFSFLKKLLFGAPANDIVIMVMGLSGAGKSTFINLASGSDLEVGYGLASETKGVTTETYEDEDGRNIVLVDTPGFDDTEISDTDTLRTIANWLEATHKRNKPLTGIIYLHRITDNRVGGTSYKSIRLFQKLCGNEAMKNVVLCTTMWDLLADEELGYTREKELAADFWKPMIDEGARITRHCGTSESAQKNINKFLGLGCVTLSIQKSLAEGKSLLETEVGNEIDKELIALREQYMRELEETKRDMDDAVREEDSKAQHMITQERAILEERLSKESQERQRLAASRTEEIAALELVIQELKHLHRERGIGNNLWQGLGRKINRFCSWERLEHININIKELSGGVFNLLPTVTIRSMVPRSFIFKTSAGQSSDMIHSEV